MMGIGDVYWYGLIVGECGVVGSGRCKEMDSNVFSVSYGVIVHVVVIGSRNRVVYS
jgi:hypothetical protein